MRLYIPFRRRPLPAFNAPALNNALQAANSGLSYDVRGRGGHAIARQFIPAEGGALENRYVIMNGIGGVVVNGSYGSQPLVDPAAMRNNVRSI